MPIDIYAGSSGPGFGGSASVNDALYDTVLSTTSTAYPMTIEEAMLIAKSIGVAAAAASIKYNPQAAKQVVNNIKDAGTYKQTAPGFWDNLASQLNAFSGAAAGVAGVAMTAMDAAKAAADSGGAAALAALKFLADNGNLFAKVALALGVSLVMAEVLAIGAGGLLLILLLKK